MGNQRCQYCGGSGKGDRRRILRAGGEDQEIIEPCMFCGGAGQIWVAEPASFGKPPEVPTETYIPVEPRKDAAEGLASLLAVMLGLFVAGSMYSRTPDVGPALISGGIAFFVARAILRWSPILALLRGAIWLLKAAVVVALILVVLAVTKG